MTESELAALLSGVRDGAVSPDEALRSLQDGPFRASSVEFADLDHRRSLRHGIGEVVYGEGKSVEQLLQIVAALSADGTTVLVTRLNDEKLTGLYEHYPTGRGNAAGRTFIVNASTRTPDENEPFIAVIAAGTSDVFVAEEACETCVAMNAPFERFYDVGVAGLHRILEKRAQIHRASALVVIAGMEGALPSVVGGLFGKPIFAVPTSVGYGANFGGITPLLAMLNSCAPGVSVLNIDNGFSAAFAACQVLREIKRFADA